MKLSFRAREDLLVRVPGMPPAIGQASMYVGREFDAKTRGYPASKQAYEVESDSDEGRRLIKLVRREGALWPADEQTAKACGVEFVSVEFKDGAYVARAARGVKEAS